MGLESNDCFHFPAIPITTFFAPKRAIQEDLVINKQDLVKDKLFHLNEPFQLINNTREIIERRYNEDRNKAEFLAAYVTVVLYYRSILVS